MDDLGITKLREIAKAEGIKGHSTFSSENKDVLIRLIRQKRLDKSLEDTLVLPKKSISSPKVKSAKVAQSRKTSNFTEFLPVNRVDYVVLSANCIGKLSNRIDELNRNSLDNGEFGTIIGLYNTHERRVIGAGESIIEIFREILSVVPEISNSIIIQIPKMWNKLRIGLLVSLLGETCSGLDMNYLKNLGLFEMERGKILWASF